MSYSDFRKRVEESNDYGSKCDLSWEEETIPLLHSGFTEPTSKDPSKGTLTIQLFFSNGSYRIRIQDRERGEQAFLDCGSLNGCFERLEAALREAELDWAVSNVFRRNGSAY